MRWLLGKKETRRKIFKMTDEYLLQHGYKEYPPTSFDNNSIVARFQKRFDDNVGKKYFINVIKWSNDYVPIAHRNEYWTQFTYEYEAQVTMDGEEDALNLNFFSSWTLERVEDFMVKFFDKMNPNYYETWDDC